MPRLAPLPSVVKPESYATKTTCKIDSNRNNPTKIVRSTPVITKRELLEIGPRNNDMDFSNIYKSPKFKKDSNNLKTKKSVDFVDNPDVPPLE